MEGAASFQGKGEDAIRGQEGRGRILQAGEQNCRGHEGSDRRGDSSALSRFRKARGRIVEAAKRRF